MFIPIKVEFVTTPSPPGDLITHYGLRFSDARGNEVFVHASKTAGKVAATNRFDFSWGAAITVLDTVTSAWRLRAIVERAEASLGTGYSLTANNCEQVAHKLFYGRAKSAQLAVGAGATAGIGAYALFGLGGPAAIGIGVLAAVFAS